MKLRTGSSHKPKYLNIKIVTYPMIGSITNLQAVIPIIDLLLIGSEEIDFCLLVHKYKFPPRVIKTKGNITFPID